MPVQLVSHPVAQDALLALRNRATAPDEFRRLAHRLALAVTLAATADLRTAPHTVDSPLGPADGRVVDADVVVVPVVRAGLGMLEAVLELVPHARVGYIGLQRDEHTARASQYFVKLPPIGPATTVLLTDPMLATGGSAVAAVSLIAAAGAHDVRLLCVVAAPEGVAALEAAHAGIRIFTPAVDRGLNAQKFILPGLGDFGDRLYGT